MYYQQYLYQEGVRWFYDKFFGNEEQKRREEQQRQLRDDPELVQFFRDFTRDMRFLLFFLIFLLIASLLLPDEALFYILLVLFLSMIVVNADKIKEVLTW